MSNKRWNAQASVRLFDESGAKKNGVSSGYSPHFRHPDWDFMVSARLEFFGDLRFPGDEFICDLFFPSWEFMGSEIIIGKRFFVCELNRIVGDALIISL
jgi:hypothetical protein